MRLYEFGDPQITPNKKRGPLRDKTTYRTCGLCFHLRKKNVSKLHQRILIVDPFYKL